MSFFDSSVVKEAKDLEKTNKAVISAFKTDKVYLKYCHVKLGVPALEPLTEEQLDPTDRLNDFIKEGSTIFETYNYNAVSVWFPPGSFSWRHLKNIQEKCTSILDLKLLKNML